MLRISQLSPATARHHLPGRTDATRWYGQAAHRLGLDGKVTRKKLDSLCDWRHPLTGASLISAPRQPRTDKPMPLPAGFLFGFSPPRTLARRNDLHSERFSEALQASAEAILHAVEAGSQIWFRQDQRLERRTTGNLLWITPLREKLRPSCARMPSASAFVFNLTWDPLDDRWKSVSLAAIMKRLPDYQQMFYDTLADRLKVFNHVPGGSP